MMKMKMDFVYPMARFPRKDCLQYLNNAAERLIYKLRSLDIDAVSNCPSIKRNFLKKMRTIRSTLQANSYHLALSLADYDIHRKNINDFTILDYGGGLGMFSLLAKEANLRVIYNDIDEVLLSDAQKIGRELRAEADYYFLGDINDVINFINNEKLTISAVVSQNVIEHIYDIEAFFTKLPLLSHGPIIMSTRANIFNKMIVNLLKKRQFQAEYLERKIDDGAPRDCFKAFFNVRKHIIANYTDKLSEKEIEILAIRTRGKIINEILEAVDEYLETGCLIKGLEHPTNTCDPLTGNWCEHLMDPYWLGGILKNSGFNVEIMAGYYGSSGKLMKVIIANLLNLGINFFRKQGLKFAPYVIIVATRE